MNERNLFLGSTFEPLSTVLTACILAAPALSGCTPGVSFGTGGAGGQSTATSAASEKTTAASGVSTASQSANSALASASSGTPTCAGGCNDGNPCTDGTCDAGVCSQAQKPVGSTGNTNEGACIGVCQNDGQCGLQLYSRAFPAAGTWTSQALSAAWTGANAPPPRGILGAEHAYQSEITLVWADDGNVYRQSGTTWMAPVPTSTFFPGLGPNNVRSTAMWQPHASPPTLALLITTTGTTPRQAFGYDMTQSFVVTPSSGNPQTIGSGVASGGPPQDTVDMDWSFPVQTNYLGNADWVIFWQHVGGKVYEWNGASGVYMGSWNDAQSPLWSAGGTPPAPDTVVGAYYYSGTVYFVAP